MKRKGEQPGSKTFEKALERLEALVDALERGNLSLEESIAHFEEGTGLIKECAGKLEAAEAKLQKLVSTEEGFKLEQLSFSEEEDAEK
jgi:exodeoxyribonuclease VII small subunit